MDTGVIEGGLNVTLTIRLLMHGKVRVFPPPRPPQIQLSSAQWQCCSLIPPTASWPPLASGVRNVLLGTRPGLGQLVTTEAAL